MNLKSLIIASTISALPFTVSAQTSIAITNPDFDATDGTSGYSTFLDLGEAGANSTTNPFGSTGTYYGMSSVSTGGNAPVATAGQMVIDAYGVADPTDSTGGTGPYPSNIIVFHENGAGSNIRLQSTNGELGGYYQDTGAKFLPYTDYTLTAYVAGAGHGNSNDAFIGVGLSGNTHLTLSGIESNNGFTPVAGNNSDGTPNESAGIVGPNYANDVDLTENPGGTYKMVSVTVDTSKYTSLVGEDILINLLANSDPYYGDAVYFTDSQLTYSPDVPEPSTYILGGLGLALLLALFRRSAFRA